MTSDPVRVTVADPDLLRSRLTVLFRLILVIPHLVLVSVLGVVAVVLAPFHWLAALISGRPSEALAGYYRTVVRYTLHVYAYLHLAAAPYPPFLGGDGYAIDATFPPGGRQSRWSIGFRGLLALPALMLATVLIGGGTWSGGGPYALVQATGALAVVGFLAWFACLITGRMPPGLRDLAVFCLGYATQTYAYLFLLTDRYPDASPGGYPAAVMPEHPVTLSVGRDDPRRSRLTTFLRLPLAVPHLLWLTLWALLAILASIAGWLATLVTGRLPAPLHRFLGAYVRYGAHVSAFLYMTANPFPGFTGAAGRYPAELTIGAPVRQRRWTVLVRLVLALPAFLLLGALGSLYALTALFGWWAAMVTGRMPRGLRAAGAYVLRYSSQTYAYVLLLSDRYPYAGPGPGPDGHAPAPEPERRPATADWMLRPETP